MKRVILFSAILISSISSYAQVSFGGQIGGNLSTSNSHPGVSTDFKVGFLAGVLAEVDFGKIGFRPELNFIQKGSKYGYDGFAGVSSYSSKLTLNYVEVPLNFVYNMPLGGSKNKLFFGLGPTIGVGLFGKYKDPSNLDNPTSDVKFDGKENSTDNDLHLKRVDVGLDVLAGFKLAMGAFAKVSFTHGFSDIDTEKGTSYRNSGVSLSIGYMLGKK